MERSANCCRCTSVSSWSMCWTSRHQYAERSVLERQSAGRRTQRCAVAAEAGQQFSPAISIDPESGCSRPAMIRSSVDLPPPLGPVDRQDGNSDARRQEPLRTSIRPPRSSVNALAFAAILILIFINVLRSKEHT